MRVSLGSDLKGTYDDHTHASLFPVSPSLPFNTRLKLVSLSGELTDTCVVQELLDVQIHNA